MCCFGCVGTRLLILIDRVPCTSSDSTQQIITGDSGGQYTNAGTRTLTDPRRRRVSVNAPSLVVTPEYVLTLACVAREFAKFGVSSVVKNLVSALSSEDALLSVGTARAVFAVVRVCPIDHRLRSPTHQMHRSWVQRTSRSLKLE